MHNIPKVTLRVAPRLRSQDQLLEGDNGEIRLLRPLQANDVCTSAVVVLGEPSVCIGSNALFPSSLPWLVKDPRNVLFILNRFFFGTDIKKKATVDESSHRIQMWDM